MTQIASDWHSVLIFHDASLGLRGPCNTEKFGYKTAAAATAASIYWELTMWPTKCSIDVPSLDPPLSQCGGYFPISQMRKLRLKEPVTWVVTAHYEVKRQIVK